MMSHRPAEDIQKIHLIAVCGTAMGALACMLKDLGYDVSGSDQSVYPPISEFLKNHNIPVNIGYRSENLIPQPDLVVVGNAVSVENPEVQAMMEMGLAYCSMPQAINRFAAAGKRQIVVSGTHGKTTTSSFIAWLLEDAGLNPSFLIGGIVSNFKSNYRTGKGEWIVLEGDEYDTAFFDKGPKFLHYDPSVTVLTSVEFDHADIFNDLDQVKRTFSALLKKLSPESELMVFDQDKNIMDILAHAGCRIAPYGHDSVSPWRLGQIRFEPPLTRFEVFHEGAIWADFKTPMIGQHNLRNLLAGIAVGHSLGLSRPQIAHALENFQGVRRRQEIRGIKNNIVVIDDFAHHPTAVKETILAVKSFYHSNRLIAVFEPRTNSSRRNIFQNLYSTSFGHADLICVRQAPMLEKIPETQRFSSKKLVQDLNDIGKHAFFFENTDGIIDFLAAHTKPKDVVLIMSNGGFDDIHTRLLERL